MPHSPATQESRLPGRRVDKTLPDLPTISVERQQRCAQTDIEPCPSPTVRKYDDSRSSPRSAHPRVPQFQQSKKWAKVHGADQAGQSVPPPPIKEDGPAESQREDDRVLTMREASFEQQRAQMKKPLASKSDAGRARRPRRISRGSSITLQEGGLCRSSATQYWKTVKATVVITPHRTARKCFGRRPANRRVSLARHRETKSGRPAERVPVPAQVGADNKRLRLHVAAPKQSPAPPILSPAAEPSIERAVNGKARGHIEKAQLRPPVPSLHDPEKDSRFSDECRAILSCMDFDRDWLLPPASVLPAVGKASKDEQSREHHLMSVPRVDPHQEISIHDPLTTAPAPVVRGARPIPAITVTTTPTGHDSPRRPQPPARTSSKTVASLSAMMNMSKSPGIPSVSESSGDPSASAHGQLYTDTPGTQFSDQSQWLFRQPSAASAAGPSVLGPTSVMSTDTLTKIEAQVRNNPHSDFQAETNIVFVSGSEAKSGGPPSIPPERPLPAIPAEAKIENEFARYRASMESRRGSRDKSEVPSQTAESKSTIQLLRNSWQSTPPVALLPPVTSLPDGRRSPHLRSSSSLKREDSRCSVRSSRSFNRHTISGPRADRVREKRMRDLASTRSNSPKSDCAASNVETDEPTSTPVVTDDDVPGPTGAAVDQLDQFPTVPISRPPSIPNAGSPVHHPRRQSTTSQASPVRQASKAKHRRNSRPVQHLSQSNIFVVVDSDPVTDRFRAGAMSPAPSIGGGHGRSGSPSKHKRTGSKLKEVTTHQQSPARSVKQRPSLDSLKGDDAPSTPSGRGKPRRPLRAIRSNSGRLSSSSDDSQPRGPTSPKKRASRPQKRRRWNSTDIGLIKILHQDLEEYYGTILKQEEKLRWQASQIHMMVRVLEPINRARGVKTSPYIGIDDPAYCTTTDEETRLSLPEEDCANQGHQRSNSTGNNSTASTTCSISTDTSKGFGDEASMTDPREYDPSPATLAPAPLSTSKGFSGAVSRAGTDATVASSPTLHQALLVTTSGPRSNLREEQLNSGRSGHSYGTRQGAADQVYQSMGVNDDSEHFDSDEARSTREAARLSVNHVLTNTEQMDRAIEQLTMFS